MTILWIYNEPFNPEAGGTERITSLIMKGLQKRGYTCLGMLVFDKHTFEMTFDGQPVGDLYEFLKKHHVDVVINQIAYETALLNAFLEKGGKQWKAEGGKIISCLHFDPKMPSSKYFFKSIFHKSLHDRLTLIKLTIFNFYYERKQNRQFGRVYREIYEKSDFFVVLSKRFFPYLHKVMQLENYDKLTAIGNPLTFDDISDERILKEKKNVCLIVARMTEFQKRNSLALKVWQIVQKHPETQKWTLKIVGDGPNLKDYKDYVTQHCIPNVVFLGQQSPEPYYREAKIFLMTSLFEGWGLTLTESLQRGVVPVVMDSCQAFYDIIDNGKNGFITRNGDINEMAKIVLQLIQVENLQITMARCALQSANRFAINPTIDLWEHLLNV